MGGRSKNLGTVATTLEPGLVTALNLTGFTVGDATIDPRVNQAGIMYHWTALKAAAGELQVGTYSGNGGTQTVPVAFQPDWVAVFGDVGGAGAVHRNSSMPGDLTVYFRNSGAPFTNMIQALVPAGFQVGLSPNVNSNLQPYHFVAVKNTPGRFASGTYAGDSLNDRSITGLGLVPKWVVVRATTFGRSSVARPDTLTGDASFEFAGAVTPTATNEVKVLIGDGFLLGNSSQVNAGGQSYMWIALGGPSGSSRVKTGKYAGNGSAGNAVFVGFQPDAVIVKRAGVDPQVYAVMRTSTMAGDNTKSLQDGGPTALAPNLIQSLTATGFTVGTDNAVNMNGTEYHWIAFRAGAGGMVASTYTGNGGASQSITGLGFSPDYLIVLPPGAGTNGMPLNSTSTMPADTAHDFDATIRSPNSIQGLDPDGFRVGTGGAGPNLNANLVVFHYVTWNAVPGRVQVGTYQGDGVDNRNLDVVGFFPEVVLVKQFPDVTSEPWTYKPASTGVGADFSFRFQDSSLAPPPLTNSIQQLRPLGFQLGSNDRVNASLATCGGVTPCTYHWVAFGPLPPQANYRSIGDTTAAFHYGTTHTNGNGSPVTATNGSPFVSCAGTCQWQTFNRGRGDVILIDPGAVPYTIAALSSENTLTLTTPYAGTTSGGKAYSIQRQYGTLQAWEDCISFNNDGGAGPGSDVCTFFPVSSVSLVADHRSEVGIAYDDSAVPAAADFTSGVRFNGTSVNGNTDATHTVTLTADGGNRHLGIQGAGVLIDNTGSPNPAAIEVYDDYVTVEWMEIQGGGATPNGIQVNQQSIGSGSMGASRVLLRNNLIHVPATGFGISVDDPDVAADLYNDIVHSVFVGLRVSTGTLASWAQVRFLNNTIYNYASSGINLSVNAGNGPERITLINNLVADSVDAAYQANSFAINGASRNNLGTDATAISASPGGGSVPSVGISDAPAVCSSPQGCVYFQSCLVQVGTDCTAPGALHLHLRSSVSANQAVNFGANLSSIFGLDIDAALRQTPWDVGADDLAATTAVKLQSFGAVPGDTSVLLEWRTASELDNLGFHVYRSLGENGPWTRLTPSLIPGLGSSAVGQAYSFRDTGLLNGTRYYYRLEDVDASSKTTSHGPVSAVPSAAAGTGSDASGGDKNGKKKGSTASSCPDWVLAAYGSALGSDVSTASLRCTRHGDPEASALGVVSRDTRQATLELRTGGFYALHEAAGTVRVFVPGFDFPQDEKAAALPIRRALTDAVVGRRVQLGRVRALEPARYSLVPSALGRAEMQVGRDGTVRATRRGAHASAKPFPKGELVKLLPSLFQGERKSAVVEIAPMRFDAERQQLVLAKRVLVRLLFTGREAGERGRGSLGRAPGSRKPASGELLARLYATSRGLHAASFEQLFPGRGRGFAASQLRLERQGEPVAFHVEPSTDSFGPGSRIYFFAGRAAASTDFTAEVAYELVRSRDGLRMPLVAAAPSGEAIRSASTGYASFETNRFYQPGLLEAPDLWLWEALATGATRVKSFTLTGVDATAAGTAELDVFLQGASESGQAVDHHVSVSVNGTLVGEAQFAGKKPYRVSLSLPASLLREGANDLSLTCIADTGVSSFVFLDRFFLAYPQAASLSTGTFEGIWAEAGTASVSGAGAVVLLDVSGAASGAGGAAFAASGPAAANGSTTTSGVRWLLGFESSGGSVRFRADAGRRYLAVSSEALLSPRIDTPEPSTLRATTKQADYLLIAPKAFLAAAEPLLQRRADQGLTTRTVAFEEIASEFGHGQPSAEAIKSFLAYAFHSWTRPSPRYVLLFGDSTYDPRNFSGTSQPSPLPALWAKTSYLWTVSDPQLAAVNGEDSLPDLAIGRLPATTVAQAESLVAKLLAWEDSGQGLDGRAALVADNPDIAGDFETDVRDIAASYLSDRSPELLLLSELGPTMRPHILDALNSGLSFLNYVGHGGAAVWASENVWNSWDAASLQAQSQQPVLVTMNCLNGYFVAPSFESLSESLVKVEGRGAIASFSPSGLSLDGPAHQYPRADGRAHERPARKARRCRARRAESLRAHRSHAGAARHLPPPRRPGADARGGTGGAQPPVKPARTLLAPAQFVPRSAARSTRPLSHVAAHRVPLSPAAPAASAPAGRSSRRSRRRRP